MEQNKIENQMDAKDNASTTFIDARVAMSKDGEYILHFLTNGTILRKHIHLYKHLMKIDYRRKTGDQVLFG